VQKITKSDMKLYIKPFLAVAFITVGFTSCYYDNIEDLHPAPIIIPGINDSTSTGCDTTKVITYTADLKEIFQTNCLICHTGLGASGGIDLSTYAGAKGAATLLIDAVTWADGIKNMPQTGKINDCSIGKIKKWVESGTPE
jgi:mono/diheme cytochrome c family protein